jgi:hypothetical protein
MTSVGLRVRVLSCEEQLLAFESFSCGFGHDISKKPACGRLAHILKARTLRYSDDYFQAINIPRLSSYATVCA